VAVVPGLCAAIHVVTDTILYSCVCVPLYSSANKCLLKVAQFSAQRELFEKAAEIYEQV